MNDTFMKEKPILPLILSMSLPMVLSMLVNSLYNIVDSFFVAQISEEAMTALSLVYPVQNFINAAGIGFGVGINAVIALYLGAGDHRKADQAATQGLVLAVIHGVVMTVCCITIMPVFLRMFTSSEAVIELGVRYSVVAFAFTLIVTVSMAFEKLFQAVGNMKTTMISLMCGCITNIVLAAAGLNPKETKELDELIAELRNHHNTTILLIEHDMKLVMGISDRIYVVNQGTPLANGTPEQIRNNPDVIRAYLGEA